MPIKYVDRGEPIPRGVGNLKIGDIVEYSMYKGTRYRILGFVESEDDDEADVLLYPLDGHACRYSFLCQEEQTIGGYYYTVITDKWITENYGEARATWAEMCELKILEEYVIKFWQV
ncbi:MAG: hypothetical protein ACRCX2_28895 [Paraclostridium sp.]